MAKNNKNNSSTKVIPVKKGKINKVNRWATRSTNVAASKFKNVTQQQLLAATKGGAEATQQCKNVKRLNKLTKDRAIATKLNSKQHKVVGKEFGIGSKGASEGDRSNERCNINAQNKSKGMNSNIALNREDILIAVSAVGEDDMDELNYDDCLDLNENETDNNIDEIDSNNRVYPDNNSTKDLDESVSSGVVQVRTVNEHDNVTTPKEKRHKGNEEETLDVSKMTEQQLLSLPNVQNMLQKLMKNQVQKELNSSRNDCSSEKRKSNATQGKDCIGINPNVVKSPSDTTLYTPT